MKKLLLLAFLVLGFRAHQAYAAIALSATSTGTTQLILSTGVTFNIVVPSGSNRDLVVPISGLGNGGATSVTAGGVAMTKISDCGSWICELWNLPNVATGTVSIVASWPQLTQTYHSVYTGAMAFTGVNQVNPVIATSSVPDALSTRITSTFASTTIVGVTDYHNGTLSPQSGYTDLYNIVGTTVAASSAAGYGTNALYGSNQFGYTGSGGTDLVGTAVLALRPSDDGRIRSFIGNTMSLHLLPPARPQVLAAQFYSSSSGDTLFGAWTASSTRAGNFGGGAIIINTNDTLGGSGCSSGNMCLFEITNYNRSNSASSTFALVNQMSSYGAIGSQNCYDGNGTSKSRTPFSLPGYLFLTIQCLDANAGFVPKQSGIIVSPDGGSHWCNSKTYASTTISTHLGVAGCDSGNWSATGDQPQDAAGFQWASPTDGSNKMGRLAIVDMMCQDYTYSCPVAKGVDPAYLYAISSNSSTPMFISRTLKSNGIGLMASSTWQVYNNGVWDSNTQNATDVSGGVNFNACCSRVSYLKDFGTFILLSHPGGSPIPVATAPYPWGPWTVQTGMVITDSGYQFPSLLAGLCPKYNQYTGLITCTAAMNGSGGFDLYLKEINLGPVGPFYNKIH